MLYQTQNPHGGDVYTEKIELDFSANTNPYGTPEGVRQAVQSVLTQLHQYPDPYCRALTRAIAAYEQIPESYILCGNGAAELIYSYCKAVHAQKAVELAPTFSEYSAAFQHMGGQVERYPLQPEADFGLDGGFLHFLREKQPDVVFLCNPNNPTGRLVPSSLLLQILEFCQQHQIRLFLDECFLDLAGQGGSLTASLADAPQLFILKAFTKNYGMAGLRLGYGMSADAQLLYRMSQTVQPWNVSVLAQAAGAAALQEQAFLQRAREVICCERPYLTRCLQNMGLKVCPSAANYLLFRGPEGLHVSLKTQGIAIRSCDNYPGLGPGWYRIAVRLHAENQRLLQAMEQTLGKESSWQKTL